MLHFTWNNILGFRDMGRKKDHSSRLHYQKSRSHFHYAHPFLATPLTASASNFGLLETGEYKTLVISSLCGFFRAESFSDNLSLGSRVGGSGSGAGEHGDLW
jgi:hypothetical protein